MSNLFTLFEIPLQALEFQESLTAVITQTHTSPVRVFFVDSFDIVQAHELKTYKRSLQLAEFCFSEGFSIRLAARFLGLPAISQISPHDWIPALFDRLQREEPTPISVFCLGVHKDSVDILPTIISQRWPKLTVAGCKGAPEHGDDEDAIINDIEQQRPSILIVGSQIVDAERFICRHWHRVQYAGTKIAIASRDTLEVIAGTSTNAPRLAQSIHLQWLFHMICHPMLFFKRYINGTLRFILLLINQKGSQS